MQTSVKSILWITSILMMISCQPTRIEKKNNNQKPEEDFDWLLGNWERLHEEKGKETFENWNKISPSAVSYTHLTLPTTPYV